LFDRKSVRRALAGNDAVVNLVTHLPPSTARMLLPGAWRENDRLRRDAVVDAESASQSFARAGGVGIVLRFAAFYGPDATQSLDMIKLARKGWAPLPGSPEAYFSSVSHHDAATAVLAALHLPAGIYNVADDEPLRHREFAEALAAALQVPPPKVLPSWVTRLTGSIGELISRSLRISNRKLRDASGWAPLYASARTGWPATIRALPAHSVAA
jgi:nucleoside-diphosphate-sugar epimerase